MDLVAPGIMCATTRQHYALSEMRTVRIMEFEGVDAAYLWVTCACGIWHNLAIGQLVDEARGLPNVMTFSVGIPDLELVLNGTVGIPVNYDLNRPLSEKDQRRAEFMAFLVDRRLAEFEGELDEMLSPEDQGVVDEFFNQIYNPGRRNAIWRLLAG